MTPHRSPGSGSSSSDRSTPQRLYFFFFTGSPVNWFSPVKVRDRHPTGRKQRLSIFSRAAAASPRGEAPEADRSTRTRSMAGRLTSSDTNGSRIKKRSSI